MPSDSRIKANRSEPRNKALQLRGAGLGVTTTPNASLRSQGGSCPLAASLGGILGPGQRHSQLSAGPLGGGTMIQWVAFDLDGVVIPAGQSFNEFCDQFGVTLTQIHEFFSDHGEPILLGRSDLFEFLPSALREWGVQDDVHAFANAWFKAISTVDPAVAQIVRRLRRAGLNCCAATNQDNRRAEYLEAHTEIPKLFSPRIYSCRVGSAKPRETYFQEVEREIDARPSQILFIDDKLHNVVAAQARGWHAETATCASEVTAALQLHLPGASA